MEFLRGESEWVVENGFHIFIFFFFRPLADLFTCVAVCGGLWRAWLLQV